MDLGLGFTEKEGQGAPLGREGRWIEDGKKLSISFPDGE